MDEKEIICPNCGAKIVVGISENIISPSSVISTELLMPASVIIADPEIKVMEVKKMEYTEKFNKLVQFIFDREGREHENNPADPGGETHFGISKKSFPNLDIKNLTEEQAKEIYYNNYWLPMNCDSYDTKLALAIFDCAVNQGVGMAKQILTELHPSILTVENYLLKRLRHYFNLCQKNPKLFAFLKDWCLRVIKCSEFIV